MAQSDQQIIDAVNEAVTYAMELAADAEGWKVEKEQGDAVIKTKKNKDGRKVWLCTATVNVSPSLLWEKMKVIIFHFYRCTFCILLYCIAC